ncbi:MAG: hypothetical protein M1308_02800 [Actinobacteria bacterium]|nr:hypothetical protein [Actinomycetota bacterium]
MKIGIASTGRSLAENVYKRFGESPAFLIYDTSTKTINAINNFSKCLKGCGPQAAQVLIDNKIDSVIVGDIDDRSLEILKTNNVAIYKGYPGTGKEALQKINENRIKKINDAKQALNPNKINSIKSEIKKFTFLNLNLTFNKEFVPYEDWCMILNHPVADKVPSNWISPNNFSEGIYYLKLEVLEMQKTKNPIEFEFGWCNFPEEKNSNIPHRCNFGIYSSIIFPGIYEHIARIKDMENTSVDSREEPWDWESGWNSPFSLNIPFSSFYFPVKLKFMVKIYSN